MATAALVGAAVVGVKWYFGKRPVEITVELKFQGSRKELTGVKVEMLQGRHVAARMTLDVLSGAPRSHVHKFKVNKGAYILRTSTVYRDGSRRKTSRKIKVSAPARWVIHIR